MRNERLEYGIREKGGRVLLGGGVEVESNGIERVELTRRRVTLGLISRVITFLLFSLAVTC